MPRKSTGGKHKSRTRGRPAATAEAGVRAALLGAAQRLFLKHGFAKVTARQIATAAGTAPAMIHYYYNNKAGLFRAILQQAIGPFVALLAQAAHTAAFDVEQLLGAHMRTSAAHPWIATLIVNEVLAEGGELRALFIRDFGSRLLPMLVDLLEQGRASGRFRADIDPRFTALSLLSLSVFPFVSRSVAAPVLGLKLEGEELQRLIEHTNRIFLHGIANPAAGVTS